MKDNDKKGDAAEPRYRLLPTVRVGRLGGQAYLYDTRSTRGPVVFVPTQRTRPKVEQLIRALQEKNPRNLALPLAEIKALFADERDRRSIDVLVRRGYLEREPPPPPPPPVAGAGRGRRDSRRKVPPRPAFADFEAKHYFREAAFFNLPREIDGGDAEVGLVGVPRSSLLPTVGTARAPATLRAASQSISWFDVYRDGVYSESGLAGGLPRVLCRGVLVKDYGDLGAEARTVGDLFAEIRAAVERLAGEAVRPIFVGGDHAITFPLVDAYLRRHPDLCLLHLDAHNDLFFCEDVVYNHAAVVSDLLFHSGLSRLYSFGLRTASDSRTQNLARVEEELSGRVHLWSIGALERMIDDPRRLDEAFAGLDPDVPCYLTLDLDVLEPEAIGGQVSTPVPGGLSWWRLYELVHLLFDRRRIVACDVVEFNPGRLALDAEQEGTIALLLTLIDRLARSS